EERVPAEAEARLLPLGEDRVALLAREAEEVHGEVDHAEGAADPDHARVLQALAGGEAVRAVVVADERREEGLDEAAAVHQRVEEAEADGGVRLGGALLH